MIRWLTRWAFEVWEAVRAEWGQCARERRIADDATVDPVEREIRAVEADLASRGVANGLARGAAQALWRKKVREDAAKEDAGSPQSYPITRLNCLAAPGPAEELARVKQRLSLLEERVLEEQIRHDEFVQQVLHREVG